MGQKLSELKGFLLTMDNDDTKRDNLNDDLKSYLDVSNQSESSESSANGNDDNSHFECMYSSTAENNSTASCDELNGNIVVDNEDHTSHCESTEDACVCTVKRNKGRKQPSEALHGNSLKRNTLRTMSLVTGKRSRPKTSRTKESGTSSVKKRNAWVLKFNCAKLKAGNSSSCLESDIPETNIVCDSCVCTGYRRTEEHHLGAGVIFQANSSGNEPSSMSSPTRRESCPTVPSPKLEEPPSTSAASPPTRSHPIIDLSKFKPEDFPIEDCDERARMERAREIAEGVEPPPGFQPGQHIQLVCPPELTLDDITMFFQTHLTLHPAALTALSQIDVSLPTVFQRMVHTQVDYVHCLVPDLLQITSCSFYWGKMDRYEAESLLEGRPEGTFLLRDSAQEVYLFSVSFRKYGRSLHARIEQWNHRFSFDAHDPSVFSSPTVCGLIEHYKDPSCCMFFEPILTIPLHRNFPFPLQHLCRAAVCNRTSYDSINQLHLPKVLKSYLKEYHYKQRVRIKRFDTEL